MPQYFIPCILDGCWAPHFLVFNIFCLFIIKKNLLISLIFAVLNPFCTISLCFLCFWQNGLLLSVHGHLLVCQVHHMPLISDQVLPSHLGWNLWMYPHIPVVTLRWDVLVVIALQHLSALVMLLLPYRKRVHVQWELGPSRWVLLYLFV